MTQRGFGGTTDSKHYLWAAHTLRTSGRLLAPDGTPFRFWGPLYPMWLAVFYGTAGVRLLHGLALLVQLGLWARIGRWLLPPHRAAALAWAMALSAAVLVPAKFIWSETVFGALGAVYFYGLLAWLRTEKKGWLVLATAAGFLLPLQRTSGFFLLAGAGAGLLLTGRWHTRWRALALHWLGCAAGGLAWNYYAELVAGPPVYQAVRGWAALGSSAADYGFVLTRWFLPLAASWTERWPWLWALVLPALLALLWPRPASSRAVAAVAQPQPQPQPGPPEQAVLRQRRLLWYAWLFSIIALLVATNLTRAHAGPHDAERYCAVLVGPVALLALARWPISSTERWRWLGRGVLACWLAYSAVRTGHNAQELSRRLPIVWPSSNEGAVSH